MDPSWAELRHFVNFLNSQLQACENSTFCNMELVGDTLEGFRSFVVQFMILMSRVREMERCDREECEAQFPGAKCYPPKPLDKVPEIGRRWASSMLYTVNYYLTWILTRLPIFSMS